MSSPSQNQTFFGMDLQALRQGMAQAWRQWQNLPVLRWLTPAVAVRWDRVSGPAQMWQTDGLRFRMRSRAADARPPRFVAVQPPEDILLRRTLTLPRMPRESLAQALALEAGASSPFAPSDQVHGWAIAPSAAQASGCRVELVLASRQRLQAFLAQRPQENADEEPELWCDVGQGPPIVLRGFGETRRERVHARGKAVNAWLLALAGLLLVAAALTPTLQLRARALQAVAAYDQLARSAAPAVRQREALVHSQGQLTELQGILAEQVQPLQVLDMVTRALPDDTSLLSFKLQGLKLSLSGQTGNAAALMQQLGRHPALREVKAPTAATRPPGAGKDSFSIEAVVNPEALAAGAPARKDGT